MNKIKIARILSFLFVLFVVGFSVHHITIIKYERDYRDEYVGYLIAKLETLQDEMNETLTHNTRSHLNGISLSTASLSGSHFTVSKRLLDAVDPDGGFGILARAFADMSKGNGDLSEPEIEYISRVIHITDSLLTDLKARENFDAESLYLLLIHFHRDIRDVDLP